MSGPIARFRVATRASGVRRQVWVLIYDDRPSLHRAHYAALNKRYDPDEDVAGGVSWTGSWWWPKPDPGPIIVMRLWTGQLTTRTIAHESTHAASAIYFADVMRGWDSRARSVFAGDDEPLAYLIGDLTAEVVRELYHHKLLT